MSTDETTVTTNNVPRDVIDAWQLTPAERTEFDYLDWQSIDDGTDSASFVRYRGDLIDLGDFMVFGYGAANATGGTAPEWFHGWDGYRSDSFFSGLVVRYVDDYERVVIGRYWS